MKLTLDGVKAYIAARLSAYLTTIGSEWSITVPTWGAMEVFEPENLQFPSVAILAGETATDYASEESPLTEFWEYHSIDIEIAEAGGDSATIQNTLLAYREAIVRIIRADNTFGNLFNRVRVGRTNYSPLLTFKDHKMMKIVRLNIIVRQLRA